VSERWTLLISLNCRFTKMNKLSKYLHLPPKEKKIFHEALFFLYLAKISLLLFSFKRCLKFFPGKAVKNNKATPKELAQIKTALARANQTAFWLNVCLVQSLAGRYMLNRRNIPSRLSLGVLKDINNKIVHHAWLKTGDFEIVNKNSDYLELSFFE